MPWACSEMAEEEGSVVGLTHLAASALKPGLGSKGENSTTSATSHCSRSGCQHWSGCVHPQHVAEKASFTWRRVKETTNLDDSPLVMGEQQEQDLVMGKGMMTIAAQHQIKKKK